MSAISKSVIQVYKCLFGLDLYEIFSREPHTQTHTHSELVDHMQSVSLDNEQMSPSPAGSGRSLFFYDLLQAAGAPESS